MKRVAGFSLMELLIALAVFALVVTLAYQSINLLLDAGRRVEPAQQAWQQLQRAVIFIERDMYQLALLRPRNNGNLGQNPMAGSIQQLSNQPEVLLEFTRAGNPDVAWQLRENALQRSTLQRVRYTFQDGRLLRQTWNLVDHVDNAEPTTHVLLEGLDAMPRLRFKVKRDGEFDTALPPDRQHLVAVEWLLEHKEFGRVLRVFPVYP